MLAGKWTKTTRPEELPPAIADADTGVEVMTLGPGHYARTDIDDNHRGRDQKVCWSGNRVAFVTERNDCDGRGLGVYEWTLRRGELDFETVSDECFWRPWHFTVRTWKRLR